MIETQSLFTFVIFALLGLVLKTIWSIGVIAAGIVVSRFIKWGNK